MNLSLAPLLGLLVLVPSWAQSLGQTERTLLSLEDEWNTARIKGDVAFLEKLYAKEFRITGDDKTDNEPRHCG